MKRITPAPVRRRRALVLSALAAAAVAALLGPGAGSALASTTASVQNGTLTVLGDGCLRQARAPARAGARPARCRSTSATTAPPTSRSTAARSRRCPC